MTAERAQPDRWIQLLLVLPYKIPIRRDRRVQHYLEQGYRIVDLQRATDREVVVTLAPPAGAAA